MNIFFQDLGDPQLVSPSSFAEDYKAQDQLVFHFSRSLISAPRFTQVIICDLFHDLLLVF
jgi:hypothetical protein